MAMYRTVVKATLKQKSSLLLFLFGLFPLLMIVTQLFSTEFMQLQGPTGSVSLLGFIAAIVSTQRQMLLPIIILAFVSCTLFYEEIKSGRLYFYKDQSRNKILAAKRLSVITVYALYFIILLVATSLTYRMAIAPQAIASQTFLSANTGENMEYFMTLAGAFLDGLITIALALTLAIKLPAGYTILSAILFTLITLLSGSLKTIAYLVPSGYSNVLAGSSPLTILLVMVLVAGVYILVSTYIAKLTFSKIEY